MAKYKKKAQQINLYLVLFFCSWILAIHFIRESTAASPLSKIDVEMWKVLGADYGKPPLKDI